MNLEELFEAVGAYSILTLALMPKLKHGMNIPMRKHIKPLDGQDGCWRVPDFWSRINCRKHSLKRGA